MRVVRGALWFWLGLFCGLDFACMPVHQSPVGSCTLHTVCWPDDVVAAAGGTYHVLLVVLLHVQLPLLLHV